MLSSTDHKLLTALLSRQEETGVAAELPPERIAEIASGSGSPPSNAEVAVLLASPVARDELVLQRRLHRMRQATLTLSQPSANDNHMLYPYRAAAASLEGVGETDRGLLELEGPWAFLQVEPGLDENEPYLLTLRLRPEVPGGLANRTLEVREAGPDGLVWLTGRTDNAGVIQAVWDHAGLRPRDRPFASGLRVEGIGFGER